MSFRKTLFFVILLAVVAAFLFFFEMPRSKEKAKQEEEEKKILDMDFDAVDRVELDRPDQTVRLEKQDDQWHLTSPVIDLADRYQVTSVINAVRFGTVIRRLTEPGASLANYGLADPQTRLTLRAGGVTKALEIGKKYQIGGGLFIKQADRPEVLIVPDSLLASLSKTVSEIRESKVFRGDHGPVVRMKIERGMEVLELVRVKKEFQTKDSDEWEWKILSPFEGFADEGQVDDLVRKAQDLVASDFIQENRNGDAMFGLDRPSLRLTLGFASSMGENEPEDNEGKEILQEETETITLAVGFQKPNQDKYFAALDQANFVITLPGDDVAPFRTDVQSLKDRHVVRFDANAAAKISLQIADSSRSISHSGPDWTFENGEKADSQALDDIIEGIENMQGTLAAEGVGMSGARFGITEHSDRIALFDADGNLLVRIVRGSQNQTLGSVNLADTTGDRVRIYNLAVEELAFWPDSIDGLKAPAEEPEPDDVVSGDSAQ